jgi:DnaK suppressor protein
LTISQTPKSAVDCAGSRGTSSSASFSPLGALESKREELRGRIRALTGSLAVERSAELMEATMAERSREETAAEVRRLRKLEGEVACAIARWNLGVFGECDCGAKIGDARLAALPWATVCIRCQGKLERKGEE